MYVCMYLCMKDIELSRTSAGLLRNHEKVVSILEQIQREVCMYVCMYLCMKDIELPRTSAGLLRNHETVV